MNERKKFRQNRQLCVKCGKKLDRETDTKQNGDFFLKCEDCRMSANVYEAMRTYTPVSNKPAKTVEEYERGEMCMICGKVQLHARRYKERHTCPHCLGEVKSTKQTGEKISEHSICLRCQWAVLHGDHLSCITRSGTGPKDKSCLRFTCRFKEVKPDEKRDTDE